MTAHAAAVSDSARRPASATAGPRLRPELVSFLTPGSKEAEAYRGLRHAVERLYQAEAMQVFAVTSATPGEGKTITALNLAGALAQSRHSQVLVVGADFHRPMLAEYFGLPQLTAPGLAEALDDPYGAPAAIRRLESLNVSVLPTGVPYASPYELLASAALDALLKGLRRKFDYVVIDAPPVLACTECRALGDRVDAFLMVVAAHRTPRPLVAAALDALAPARIAGLVLNGDHQPGSNYYGY